MRSDRLLTVRMIANELGRNSERVWRIITEDVGMRKICTKMVSRLLNEGQKEWLVQVYQDILEQLKTVPNLLKRVVTGDDGSWILEYDPLTKRQSLEWKSAFSPRPKKAKGVQVQNQGDADRFFCCPWNCPRKILATWPNY